ncbi:MULTISPECIES: hypothetical protein [Rhizobium]|uniref:hypothetical protein n=1 Tax=Rhizobium TaxID=379 RepID=UPI00195B2602|nr:MULTISPECIES: hypothetical protein [Rhizobium]MBM7048942.1 hypothetical protein [Rhizobium lusitanum]
MDEPEKHHVENRTTSEELPKKGGVFAALRNSPLVGVDLDLRRPRTKVREISFGDDSAEAE